MKRSLMTMQSARLPVAYRMMIIGMAIGISAGIAFAAEEKRFIDHRDGTVTDTETGLRWLLDADEFGPLPWTEALDRCESLGATDFDWLSDGSMPGDWRLPDHHELRTLTAFYALGDALPEDHPFRNVREARYWTRSEGYDNTRAWSVQPNARSSRRAPVAFTEKTEPKHVWPVRGEAVVRHKGRPELVDDYEGLSEREQRRAERDALWDFQHLRRQDGFVEAHTDAFLRIPADLEDWYPDRFTMARTPPRIWYRILPDLQPEYFPEGEAYSSGWSNWAMITRGNDDDFYMAAGDHRGRGSNINIYQYRLTDGPHGTVEKVLDVGQALSWHQDMYTDGKIHGYMRIMPNGDLWAATHHGPYPNEAWYAEGYRGSWLFSFNIHTRETTNYGVPLVGNSLPYFSVDTRNGYFMGSGNLDQTVLGWDINEQRVRFAGYPPNGWIWWRVVFLPDERTGLFWGMDESEEPYRFMSFDPELNRFERYDLEVPRHPETGEQGRISRLTIRRDADGWHYGHAGGVLFRFRPDGADGPEAEALSIVRGSVHQISMCPAQRYVYYVPRVRGWPGRGMIQQYDIKTGAHKTLAFLADHILKHYGISFCHGAYGAKISACGSFLVVLDNGWSSADAGLSGFPILLVVEIPESERELD